MPPPTQTILRWTGRTLAVVAGLLAVGAGVGCCSFSAPGYRGPKTERFDGETFHNQEPVEEARFVEFLEWQLSGDAAEWPGWIDAQPGPPPPERVGDGQLRVTFVNHATTLIQVDGVNVLTDPHFSERASPLGWIGPKRHRRPGLRFTDLPPIDAVVISHNHYDHLDVPTLERLRDAHDPVFLVGLGNTRLLHEEGITRAVALDWWQKDEVAGLWFNFVPAQHFSGRGLCDRNENLWGGWVIESSAGPIYFAGDTGWGPHFAQVRQRFGPPRLALLPIGAYAPRRLMGPVHIDPAEAVRAHRTLEAHRSVGMHFGTFRLTDEAHDAPAAELADALDDQGVDPATFWVLGEGEGRNVE